MFIPTTHLTNTGVPGADGGAYPESALQMYVDYANGDDGDDGLSPSDAKKTVQAAYDALTVTADADKNLLIPVNVAMTTYTATNVTPDRSYDADTVAVAELADVVGTLIADLRARGWVK